MSENLDQSGAMAWDRWHYFPGTDAEGLVPKAEGENEIVNPDGANPHPGHEVDVECWHPPSKTEIEVVTVVWDIRRPHGIPKDLEIWRWRHRDAGTALRWQEWFDVNEALAKDRRDFKLWAIETAKEAFSPLAVHAHWTFEGKLAWSIRDPERGPAEPGLIGDETHFDIAKGSSEKLLAVVSHARRRLEERGYSLEPWSPPEILPGF